MYATIGTWIVIVSMLFGGTGASALAAQDSLPTDFLYPVKIFGEEMHLAFSPGPQARLALLSRYSERRMGEILDMLGEGQPLAEEWAARWQEQFNLALQAAAQLDDPAMIRALEQTRLRLHLQEQRLQADPREAVERVRTQLRQQQRLVDDALDDPAAFRLRARERKLNADPTPGGQAGTPLPGRQGDGHGPGPHSTPPCDTCTPALDGTGPGPGPQSTPPCDTCNLVQDGTGPGPGPQSTPPCDTCTPALDGTGPGPGPGYQGGDDQPAQPPEQRGSGGGVDQGSDGANPNGNGEGDTGSGNDNSGTGGGPYTSCGGGGGSPRHP